MSASSRVGCLLSVFLLSLVVVPHGIVFADPQLEVSVDLYGSNHERGSIFTFNVVARNSGSGDAVNPSATVFTSDPANIRIVGSDRRDWYGRIIPSDGRSYDLGEFAFQVGPNAPDGTYVIRIEVSYSWQRTTLVASRTLELVVEGSPSERAAAQVQSTLMIGLLIGLLVIVFTIVAVLVVVRRRH